MNNLGERILYLLNENKISRAELSRKINVSKTMISNYIDNKSEPTATVLYEMANTLGVSIDYLVFGHEEYMDEIEEQLLEAFRDLNEDNKVIAVGEIMKLLTMQKLKEKGGK